MTDVAARPYHLGRVCTAKTGGALSLPLLFAEGREREVSESTMRYKWKEERDVTGNEGRR